MDKKTALPSHWEIKKMTEVVTWGSGGTPKATEKSYYENGTIPWLIIGDLNDGIVNSSLSKITELGLKNSSAKMIPVGTLLVAMYGSIGKLGITGIECCTNQAIAFAKELHGVTTKYMFYYMSMIKPKLISMGKGGTQKNISQSVLKSLDVVVPPIPEQECIVSKIEELFSKLDASVAELQTAKEKLKVYRQAVLKEAFDPVSKEKILLEDIIEKPRYGTSKKCSYAYKNGFKAVYRIPNICYQNGSIDHKDIKYAGFSDDELKNLDLIENDLLIIRSNGSVSLVGRSSIVKAEDCDATFAGYLIRLRLKKPSEVLSKFLHYFLESHAARTYIEHVAKSTSGVNNINSNEISNLPVPKCDDFDMQAQTVVKIETNLSICDDIQQTIDTSLQQAEALRQSILKQAFEGEL